MRNTRSASEIGEERYEHLPVFLFNCEIPEAPAKLVRSGMIPARVSCKISSRHKRRQNLAKSGTKKIMLVFGTRPEAIKMAPLCIELSKNKKFDVKVCVTAQHRQMLDDVLDIFCVRPDYDLNIMQDGQSLYHITSESLLRLEKIYKKEKPDMVLVHGDTTTTFAAALAAFYERIPVGHVEAGLRTGDFARPFPEEANRVLTDSITSLYFAPTANSQKALLLENTDPKKIFVTGNTVIDALKIAVKNKRKFKNKTAEKALFLPGNKRLILMTCHRRENFGEPVKQIFSAVRSIALKYSEVEIIYPMHMNPNVALPAKKILGQINNIHLTMPLDYLDLCKVLKKCSFVLTDSGGLQEEAPALGKPVLLLREATERPEAVAAGTVRIVGSRESVVKCEMENLLMNKKLYDSMSRSVNPYGDGLASHRTAAAIEYYFSMRRIRPLDYKANLG